MARRARVADETATGTPKRRSCGAMQVHYRLLEQFPAFRARQTRLEHAFAARLRSAPEERTRPYKIQVVVHVVYRTEAENIDDSQVKSQLVVLNKDYRAANPDRTKTPAVWKGLIADPMVEFALAAKDPQGGPTTGITRTRTTKPAFSADDSVKSDAKGGKSPWPTGRYLNIWVCKLAGGLLGYAQFPGGPAKTDGVVILNTAFGTSGIVKPPFNLGRTTTHEVGHFLNLRHIWGDTEDCSGSDFVDDTPNAENPNYKKPTYPHITCNNGPYGDMFMNYMDYVDDDSMFMFTLGQVVRMHAALDGPRSSLVT